MDQLTPPNENDSEAPSDNPDADPVETILFSGYAISDSVMAGAAVIIESLDGDLWGSGTTAANGFYSIELEKSAISNQEGGERVTIYGRKPGRITIYGRITEEDQTRIIPSDGETEDLQVNPITTGLDEYCRDQPDPEQVWKDKINALPEEVQDLVGTIVNEGIVEAVIDLVQSLGMDNIIAEIGDDGVIDGSSTSISSDVMIEEIALCNQGVLKGTWINPAYNGMFGYPPGKIVYNTPTSSGLSVYMYNNADDTAAIGLSTYTYKGLDPRGYVKYQFNHLGDYYNVIFRTGKDSMGRSGEWQEFQGVWVANQNAVNYPSEFSGGTYIAGTFFKESTQIIDNPVSVTSLSIDQGDQTIEIGDQLELSVTILPADATVKGVYWESSDDSIVAVDSGLLIGLAEGNASITCRSVEGNQLDSINVSVIASGSGVGASLITPSLIEVNASGNILGNLGAIDISGIPSYAVNSFVVIASTVPWEQVILNPQANTVAGAFVKADGSFSKMNDFSGVVNGWYPFASGSYELNITDMNYSRRFGDAVTILVP